MFGQPHPQNVKNTMWSWPQTGGTGTELLASALQHEVVVAARTAVVARTPSLRQFAIKAQLRQAHLYSAMSGDVPMLFTEFAALMSLRADWLPVHEKLRETIVTASTFLRADVVRTGGTPGSLGLVSMPDLQRTLSRELGLRFSGATVADPDERDSWMKDLRVNPGHGLGFGYLGFAIDEDSDEIAAIRTLALLAGNTLIIRTDDYDELCERLRVAAAPAMVRVATAQSTAYGLPSIRSIRRTSVHSTHHLAPEAMIRGWATDEEPVLTAMLPSDWIETVKQPGWAVLDGTFTAAIYAIDDQRRPTHVEAMYLAPTNPDPTRPWHEQFDESDWEYATAPATVTWTKKTPTVTFDPRDTN